MSISPPNETPVHIVITTSESESESIAAACSSSESDSEADNETSPSTGTTARALTDKEKPKLVMNGKLNFPRVSLEVYREQAAEKARTMKAEWEAEAAARKIQEENKKEKKTQMERERKQAYRARLEEREISDGTRDAAGVLLTRKDPVRASYLLS